MMQRTDAVGFLVGFAVSWLALALAVHGKESNDSMYPPAEAARPAIAIDGRGFTINGQRTYLASGAIHYPRVPRELWRDRLLRMQRAGFNCVESCVFWNYHEPREGQWRFAGDADVDAFYATAQDLGLYGIARVGGYVCAEWDFGGYPVWLKFKPPFKVRQNDPLFLKFQDRWYDRILPIVVGRQIHRGGNIVMVQLENEHPRGWGVVGDEVYHTHLREKALAAGVEVPFFFSGLNHGHAPSPRDPDTTKRQTPWFSTEFWGGWFDKYSDPTESALRRIDETVWRIVSRGTGGYNIYMLHGGTNFETWNDPSGAASYDFGAAIGQAGDLRRHYYRFKRANQLAMSFPEILAGGEDASAEFKDLTKDAGLVGARRNASAGAIAVFRNQKPVPAVVTLSDGTRLSVNAGELFPLLCDVRLTPEITIAASTARVLAVARNGGAITVVTYGQPGDIGRLALKTSGGIAVQSSTPAFALGPPDAGGTALLSITFPNTGPDACELRAANGTILRVVALSDEAAWFTWVVGRAPAQYVVCGPEYVGDFEATPSGGVAMTIERRFGNPGPGRVVVYGGAGPALHLAAKADLSVDARPAPALDAWQMSLCEEAMPTYDDKDWLSSDEPQQMGADGDTSAFAWYRATVRSPIKGEGTIQVRGADNLVAFVNGRRVEVKTGEDQQCTIAAEFVEGENTVAVFTSHAGRNKAFAHLGPIKDLSNKGLFGPVTAKVGGQSINVTDWRQRGGVAAAGKAWTALAANAERRPALYQASFAMARPGAVGAQPVLRASFAGLSRGTMWLNGHNLGRYPEKIRLAGLYMPECWLNADGHNVLTVFDEEGNSPEAVRVYVETTASREAIRVTKSCEASVPMTISSDRARKAAAMALANRGNLAMGKPTTATSSAWQETPSLATDGDPDTRWTAGPKDGLPQSLTVDLGSAAQIGAVEIVWEHENRKYGFTVEGSIDGTTWLRLGNQDDAVPTSPDSVSQLSRLNLRQATSVRHLRVTVERVPERAKASIGEVLTFAP